LTLRRGLHIFDGTEGISFGVVSSSAAIGRPEAPCPADPKGNQPDHWLAFTPRLTLLAMTTTGQLDQTNRSCRVSIHAPAMGLAGSGGRRWHAALGTLAVQGVSLTEVEEAAHRPLHNRDQPTPTLSVFVPNTLAARLLATSGGSRIVRRMVKHGEAVFHEGDPAMAVFLVEAGRIHLARMSADGSAHHPAGSRGRRQLR
jgi:hypothetical protein